MAVLSRFEHNKVRRLRNALFDLRSGGLLVGGSRSRYAGQGANDVANSDITALERIFDGRVRDSDVIVDVGCGKGRVVRWCARRRMGTRVVGLELDEEIAAEAARDLSRYENASIIAGDAIQNLPADASLIYLYNPFTEQLMRAFSERVKELAGERRGVRLLYYNPQHANIFRDDPAWTVEDVTIGGEGFHPLCVIRLGDDPPS